MELGQLAARAAPRLNAGALLAGALLALRAWAHPPTHLLHHPGACCAKHDAVVGLVVVQETLWEESLGSLAALTSEDAFVQPKGEMRHRW